jgi:Arc/MetJ-type ribon-helix-helix transcriptional regulator
MTDGITGGEAMRTSKIAISLSETMLKQLDDLVSEARYPSRSGAIQEAVQDLLERTSGSRLARECSKLDPEQEVAIAEEGMSYEKGSWPQY